ncbi:MAG TPA: hypothetical protein VN229_11015 [Terriglobales bacterium]|nr:hypothetical protein [Terriglobales bacterium]
MMKAPHILSLALWAAVTGMALPAIAADSTPPAAGALPSAFNGTWFVSAVFPTGVPQGNAGDPHLGALVMVKAGGVSDVNGRRCAAPRFESRKVKDVGAALGFSGAADQLQVTCAGQPFATLLLVPGKALAAGNRNSGSALLSGKSSVLFARRPEALYLLERAEQALYRQATIGAVAPSGSESVMPVPEKPIATAPEAPAPEEKKVPQKQAVAAKAKPQAKAPATAQAIPPAKTTPAMKTAAPAKLTADATQQSKAKTQKSQLATATTKAPAMKQPAASQQASAQAAKPATKPTTKVSQSAVPDVALLESDVSGAKPQPSKAAGTGSKAPVAAKPAATQAAAQATKTAPKPGMAIQLASYSGIGAATAGWQSLHSAYPELMPLKPLYVAADNAPIVHLYATGAATDKLRQICGDLQSKQAYCTISQ